MAAEISNTPDAMAQAAITNSSAIAVIAGETNAKMPAAIPTRPRRTSAHHGLPL
ncbi:hypothetical protein D3C83_153580 [compost metagenome]